MTSASKLLFGTAGIPHQTTISSTLKGIQEVKNLGLDCLEIEFVKGIKMSLDLAQEIKKAASASQIRLSLHAPYYINLNSVEEGKRLSSQERLLTSGRIAKICGAESVVFHPGYYGEKTSEETYQNIRKGISEIISILKAERNNIILRPETMGKKTQFGSLEETLRLCRETEGLLPCLDFSHLHAREGKINSYSEFQRIFKKVEKKLGILALKNAHIHISGSEYNAKGERKHINLQSSDFRYDEWIQALKDLEVEGMVICESPNLEKDALMLKNLYQSRA